MNSAAAKTPRWVDTPARQALERYLDGERRQQRVKTGQGGLSSSADEFAAFQREFAREPFVPTEFEAGQQVRGFIGLDGGSTSTKAVLLSTSGEVLTKVYRLSQGNPIQDAIDMFGRLRQAVESRGATLEVLGVGTTGYAKDTLRDVLQADTALVETVAHTEAALAFYTDPHVIVDVGGQDIKLIVLRDGRVVDFKLNTQCSAGNGYFLQATAEQFGVPLDQYAEVAFAATMVPRFGYGCAVFLQSDIVNFQRQGWRAGEILAGLARVLPQNVFLYVAGTANLAKLGSRFVLQGGTQNNLAVVKAEVDFIRSHFGSDGAEPRIVVHEHCGEAGAIGAAVEAKRLWQNGRHTTFIGFDQVARITYRATRNEETRCHFCKNACLRTFIDVHPGDPDERRFIVATCEKGAAPDVEAMRSVKAGIDAAKAAQPEHGRRRGPHGLATAPASPCRRPRPRARLDATRSGTPREDAGPRADQDWHSPRAEPVRVRALVQRLPREPGRGARQHRLLRLHDRRAVPGGCRPRRHRSLLPLEGCRPARPQPAVRQASAEAAGLRVSSRCSTCFAPRASTPVATMPVPPPPRRPRPSRRRSRARAISSRLTAFATSAR